MSVCGESRQRSGCGCPVCWVHPAPRCRNSACPVVKRGGCAAELASRTPAAPQADDRRVAVDLTRAHTPSAHTCTHSICSRVHTPSAHTCTLRQLTHAHNPLAHTHTHSVGSREHTPQLTRAHTPSAHACRLHRLTHAHNPSAHARAHSTRRADVYHVAGLQGTRENSSLA